MKLNDLGKVVREYDGVFYNSLREYGKNNLTLDDHIFTSKKYVNTLDVDSETNVELQKYFVKHVEGLHRAVIEPQILCDIIMAHDNSFTSQIDETMRKFLGVMTPTLAGFAAYLDTKNIPVSVAVSALTFTAFYFVNKISSRNYSRNNSNQLSKIVGTPEYKNKIFYELENKLIDMGKLTVD